MKQRIPGDPRCVDWRRCARATVSHGSGRPERWVERGDDKSPWWMHAQNWNDIHLALLEGLPVFLHTGHQIEGITDLMELQDDAEDHRTGSTLEHSAQVLIPTHLHEIRERKAIESILNQQ